MNFKLFTIAGLVAIATTGAQANEFEAQLIELSKGKIAQILADDEILSAIKAQNAATAAYDQAKVDGLDLQWRAEVGAADQPLIKSVTDAPASARLVAYRKESEGLFTEIFVMDAKGLNVAMSDVTSDYWQGDEDKWQKTFGVGADSIHISDVEQDESTQIYQSQVSVPVVDGGVVIGAVTFGVDVEQLD